MILFTGAGSIFHLDFFTRIFSPCGRSGRTAAALLTGLNMVISNSDRDTLRVVSAFQEIKSPGTRRAILRLLEELVEKQSKSATTKGD
jgi:hypothetical protein